MRLNNFFVYRHFLFCIQHTLIQTVHIRCRGNRKRTIDFVYREFHTQYITMYNWRQRQHLRLTSPAKIVIIRTWIVADSNFVIVTCHFSLFLSLPETCSRALVQFHLLCLCLKLREKKFNSQHTAVGPRCTDIYTAGGRCAACRRIDKKNFNMCEYLYSHLCVLCTWNITMIWSVNYIITVFHSILVNVSLSSVNLHIYEKAEEKERRKKKKNQRL